MFPLKFANNIKKKYQERLINRERQWPHYHGEKLISLYLTEGERDKKELESNRPLQVKGHFVSKEQREQEKKRLKRTPIAYADLFKVEGKKKTLRKVLIEGDAGIGKTTLCTTISEDWANDKLFQRFRLLLLLPLREKKVAKASSLLELLKLFHSSENLCTSVAHFIEEEDGENTLIVADGWDELGVPNRNKDTFLYKLLFGKIFPFMSVLVTSRYSASTSLHNLPHIDRFVEIRGFNKENVAAFIESEFSNDRVIGQNLLKKLENSPLIGSVCSVPLCCIIICHLWRTLQEDLPTTMTELYTKITLNILIRNVRKSFSEDDDSLTQSFFNFDSLPEDLKQSWNLLCEFAFLTITKDQIVFSRDELANFWPHNSTIVENIFRFGLLQSVQSIFDVGCGTSFHFLHLTFQEFLAALHLSKQPFETKVQVCNKYAKVNRFDMVVRFLFGITAQRPCSKEGIDKLLTSISYSCTPWTICHSLFEADHTNLTPVESICEQILNFGYQLDYTFTSHDFSAFIHFVSQTCKCYSLLVNFANCGVTSNQLSAFGQALASKMGNLQVEGINLSGNMLTDDCVSILFSVETAVAFKSLKSLTINYYEVGCNGLRTIMSTVEYAQLNECILHTLNLSYNPLGISGLQVLEQAICRGTLTSLITLILRGSLTNYADTNAAVLISLSASLSAHCWIITRLDVSENNLGLPGTRALGTVLSQLNQRDNNRTFCLELADTNFRSIQNITFLSHQSQCVSINLSNNPIGLDGVIAIGHMISNSQISALYLDRCQLTRSTISLLDKVQNSNNRFSQSCNSVSSIGWQLCTIKPSSSLIILNVNGNDFSGKNIDILAGIIHLCPLLLDLSCNNCSIDSNDLINLLILLNEMKSLPHFNLLWWMLDDNDIDDKGISILIEYLPSFFPKLKGVWVKVEHNLVSRQMRQKLDDALNQVILIPQGHTCRSTLKIFLLMPSTTIIITTTMTL